MLFHTISDAMPFLPLMPPRACLCVCPMLCFIGLFLIDDAQANMGLFVHKLRRTLFSLVAHNLPHAFAMVACVVGTTLELLLCGCLVSAANPHLLRFSQICPRLDTFWSFSLLRRNRRPAAQSQDQTYIFLMCRI